MTQTADTQKTGGSVSPTIQNAHILIVDDMALMRQMIGTFLRREGYTNIHYAEDGVEALEKIAVAIPDILILDLNMPRMSGYDVCRSLRSQKETKNLPILVQSASESADERVKVFASGATDFVTKPLNQPELLARVSSHLEKQLLIEDLSAFRERMDVELSMSRDMQQALIPTQQELDALFTTSGFKISSHCEMSSELGGDLWGSWMTPNRSLGLFIIDISGHGVGSALSTFTLHGLMARYRPLCDDPAAFLTALNADLKSTLPTGQFATMGYFVINPSDGGVIYSGAASPRPFLMRKGSTTEVEVYDTTGFPLGVVAKPEYENKVFKMDEGDVCFFYSDVLLEAIGTDGERLHEDGLKDLVSEIALEEPEEGLVTAVIDEFYRILDGPLPDDLTAISLEVVTLGQGWSFMDAETNDQLSQPRVLLISKGEGERSEVADQLPCSDYYTVEVTCDAELMYALDHARDNVTCVMIDSVWSSEEQLHFINLMQERAEELMPSVICLAEDAVMDEMTSSIKACVFFPLPISTEIAYLRTMINEAVTEQQKTNFLKLDVSKRRSAIGDIQQGSFKFRTREEALHLATMLSLACPEPSLRAVGLVELTANAIEHGCLKIGSLLKTELVEQGWLTDAVRTRRTWPEFTDGSVTISFERHEDHILIEIRDPGDGFDPVKVIEEFDPKSVAKSGRGVVMAQQCFDSVTYNEKGNVVTLVINL